MPMAVFVLCPRHTAHLYLYMLAGLLQLAQVWCHKQHCCCYCLQPSLRRGFWFLFTLVQTERKLRGVWILGNVTIGFDYNSWRSNSIHNHTIFTQYDVPQGFREGGEISFSTTNNKIKKSILHIPSDKTYATVRIQWLHTMRSQRKQ